jgi:hypothetical protein
MGRFRTTIVALLVIGLLTIPAQALAAQRLATASVTAQNTGTSATEVSGLFSVSLSGTFTATIWLQRSFDSGATWLDVESYTVPVEKNGEAAERQQVRLFCKTGGYTNGTAVCRVSQ